MAWSWNFFQVALRAVDKHFTGGVVVKLDSSATLSSEVYQDFKRYCQELQLCLKSLGLIILQLLQGQQFSEEEFHRWRNWRSQSANSENAEGLVSKRILSSIATSLTKEFPGLANLDSLIRDLLAVCFLDRLQPALESQHGRKGQNSTTLRFPAWKTLNSIAVLLENRVTEDEESGSFVRKLDWTAEDEKGRIRDKILRSKTLEKKARQGVRAAKERVRLANHNIWWTLQSDDFRTKAKRRQNCRAQYLAQRRIEQDRVHLATFRHWRRNEFQEWLQQSMEQYLAVISEFEQLSERIHPKKPEVFISKMLSEYYAPFDEFVLAKLLAKSTSAIAEFLSNRRSSGITGTSSDHLSKLESIRLCWSAVLAKAVPAQIIEVFSSLELEKLMSVCSQKEAEMMEAKRDKLLIISEQQLHFKRVSIQAKYLCSIFPELMTCSLAIGRNFDILDREFSRFLVLLIATCIVMKYLDSDAAKLEGVNFAACRICSFFRMVCQRRKYLRKLKRLIT